MVESSGMEAVLSRWKDSGLSLRRFGEKEGVSYSKLVYWRRKLHGVRKPAAVTKPKKRESDLVPVQVISDESRPMPSPGPFSVWLGNGIAVDVPAGFDDRELRRLVDLLGSC